MRGLWIFWMAAAACSLNASAADTTSVTPGGISISPVRVDLAPGRRAEAVTVTNAGAYRRTIEVEVLRWSQVNGEDRYEPTREVIANPPLFFIAPGASQTVRVGRPASAKDPSKDEAAYRVYFRETQPPEPSDGNGLKFALRIGVPVFVRSAATVRPEMRWTLNRDAEGSLRVRADNRGAMHARLADVRLKDVAGGEWPLDGFRYVLPGAWQEWVLPADQVPAVMPQTLSALTETGRTEYGLGASAP